MKCSRVYLSVIALLTFFSLTAQEKRSNQVQELVNWQTWEQVDELTKIEKKKIFVELYTSWCTWCKKMDKMTLQQAHIARFLNEHFYNIKFNAQTSQEILFNNEIFRPGKRYHELAKEITFGKLGFPTIVFIDEDLTYIPVPGYRDVQEFEVIISYFAGDFHKSITFEEYKIKYKKKKNRINQKPVISRP